MSGHSDVAEPQAQCHAADRRDARAAGDPDHHAAGRDACRQTQFATGRLRRATTPSVRVDIYSAGEMYWNDEHVDSIAQLIPRFAGAGADGKPAPRQCGARQARAV